MQSESRILNSIQFSHYILQLQMREQIKKSKRARHRKNKIVMLWQINYY